MGDDDGRTTGNARPPSGSCQLCGAPVPESPVTWMLDRSARGPVWTCPDCARRYLRSIESKLDQEYW
jgi:hypothetical protein